MKTNEITTTTITPAALLTAARDGKITASILDAETLSPLAGGDGPEQYPSCTIGLHVDGNPDLETSGQRIGVLTAWKLVYYSVEGDTMNSGHGTYDFRAISSDGCTRGDATVTIQREAPAPQQCEPEDADDTETPAAIVISTGEGCTSPDEINIVGLTEEEAEEVREAIESAIEEAYSDWEPEHPSDEEIYEALTAKKRETTEVEYLVGGTKNRTGEFVRVLLYAGTHCGKPQFALEPMDDDQTVYEDAAEAAKAAREKLVEILQAAIDDEEALNKQEREAAEALEAALKED